MIAVRSPIFNAADVLPAYIPELAGNVHVDLHLHGVRTQADDHDGLTLVSDFDGRGPIFGCPLLLVGPPLAFYGGRVCNGFGATCRPR